MSKRKRDDFQNEDFATAEKREWRNKITKLKGKIFQGHKSLIAALKLSKGLERQKMGRRQKQAANDPKRLLRLREEVIVLREMDLTKVAQNYLLKQMLKFKRLRESTLFSSIYGLQPTVEGPRSQAEANVLGLLFKSSPITQILPNILQGIRDVLESLETKDSSNEPTSKHHLSGQSRPDKTVHQGSDIGEDDFQGFSDQSLESPSSLIEDTADTASEFITEKIASHGLVADSDEKTEDSDELSQVDYLHDVSISSSGSQNDDGYLELESDSEPSRTPRNVRQGKPTSTTTFLPSLSMGGYYSGSESENDDLEDTDRNNFLSSHSRKNRRGQRERQKIAEKKFGSGANHLLNQSDQKRGEVTWDAKRGATINSKGRPLFKGRENKGTAMKSGATAVARNGTRPSTSTNPKINVNAPIHPSWQAARQRKQDKIMAEFSGKKVTFD